MRRIAALLIVALAGCSSSAVGAGKGSSTPSTGTQSLRFGQSFRWRDGIVIRAVDEGPFKLSTSGAMVADKAPMYLSFRVTITNGGATVYDPSAFTATLQAGNAEAAEVVDTARGVDGAPMTKLLPGRSTSFRVAFGTRVASRLVLDVSPSFDGTDALFTD